MRRRLTTRRIDRLSRLVEEALQASLRPSSGAPRPFHEAMRYCVFSGGKRYRPLLCLGACEAVGGQLRKALPVACAIECIHTYSLVHDDLPAMDNAAERRGKPSCHRRFGEATAILVGDALLTRAFELLSANGTPNALTILHTLSVASGTTGLIGGQVLDLKCGVRNAEFGVKDLEDIAKRKTAALITASVVAGGMAGRGSSDQLRRLQRYGMNLGLAFQLMDDLHDGDGLAQAMGTSQVHRRAQQLVDQAMRTLKPFRGRAQVLIDLAQWLMRT